MLSLWKGQHDYHVDLDDGYYAPTDKQLLKLAENYFVEATRKGKPSILIVKLKRKPIGFISFEVKEPGKGIEAFGSKMSRYGEVIDLYLVPEVRRKGFGAILLQEIEKRFKDRSVNYMMVEIASANFSAVEFYKKHGFATHQLLAYKKI